MSTFPSIRQWPSLDLDARLVLLSGLVDYWCPPSGDPAERPRPETGCELPQALAWFYDKLATHTDHRLQKDSSGWTAGDPIVTYHWVKQPWDLRVDESGIIEFLNETQGVYQCGVGTDGCDPRVVTREFDTTRWEPQADRLSDFLLVLLAFELLAQGERAAMGSFPDNDVSRCAGRLERVYLPVVWMSQKSVTIYHGEGVMILAVANSDAQTTYLQAAAQSEKHFDALRSFGQWEQVLP